MKYIFLIVLLQILALTYCKNILTAKWVNELGSEVDIKAQQSVNGVGLLTGIYYTKVSRIGEPIKSKLYGSYRFTTNKTATLGFTVNWSFKRNNKKYYSVTSWSGLLKEDGRIHTTWVLTNNQKSDWNSTLINRNIFRKKVNINL